MVRRFDDEPLYKPATRQCASNVNRLPLAALTNQGQIFVVDSLTLWRKEFKMSVDSLALSVFKANYAGFCDYEIRNGVLSTFRENVRGGFVSNAWLLTF